MVRFIMSLASLAVGVFTLGCRGTAGKVTTQIDGVDLTAATNGQGGASFTVSNGLGSIEIDAQAGHHPAVIVGPTTKPVDGN